MQQITIIGNLGTDARVETINDREVIILDVAVSAGKDKPCIWYRVIRNKYSDNALNDAWKKGAGICATGRLEARAYMSSKYNDARISLTVWADTIEVTKFVDNVPADKEAPAAPAHQAQPAAVPQTQDLGAQVAAAANDPYGDLPF